LGSTELAIESLGKAFSINPGNPVIVNSYASILMRNNDPQRADDVLQQSIEAGNRGIDVMKLMIQVKLRLGDWDRAEQLAQQLKGVEGQEALSQQMLGLVYQGKQQPDQSIGAFKRAHDLSPKSSEPIVALVKAYVGNNQVDEAESFLQTLIKENENNITAYMLLGQLSLRAKDTPAAIGYFTRTIRINPAFVQGYRTLAGIHVGGNKLADAENILREGLLELPGNTALTISLASVFEKKQDFDRAIEVYEGLLEKNPDIIVAKNNLASLLTDQRQDQASYDRARQIAAEFRDSPIPQFRDTYAWAAVKSGTNLEEAAVILESIVKDNEQVDVYHYHLGEAYRKKGDAEKAMVQLEKAIELAAAGSDVAEKARASLELLK
jgi:tetratricopeptide (TPR) repeat protein